jgi:two-component system OmpR family sensor kinase
MSIRLRFTLLYNAILALTLLIFGTTLYSIQSQTTFKELKKDLVRSSDTVGASVLRTITKPVDNSTQPSGMQQPPPQPPRQVPFENFSSDKDFQRLPEREIVRVLDAAGNLVASPFGRSEDALPLSDEGLEALARKQTWWQTEIVHDQRMLIYNRPIIANGEIAYILQIARPLTERDRSLQTLANTLLAASAVTLVVAFGIGWVLSGITLQPIQRITQTARSIGDDRDFTRRVEYNGPQDEVGHLATTFNAMLARLQDAYQRVAHSLEMQRNFVADVSHELRTPLTTLHGNLGLLRRDPPVPADEQVDILNDMVEESDRLIRLVNNLLVLARADVAKYLVKEKIAIRPIIEETCRQVQQLDLQREIAIQAVENLYVMGDCDALKQVLLIALDNALKHSNGAIEIFAETKDGEVEIRVQDHGAGIAPEKLAHVFDRFYRGEENPESQGFGLGLPIALSLVQGQGGSIRLESQPGEGSQLIIRFPMIQ